jgi:hypothetical protein
VASPHHATAVKTALPLPDVTFEVRHAAWVRANKAALSAEIRGVA